MESQLLRFTTAGSVDNGKSTLIGRLLYDSKSIFEDQLKSVEEISRRTAGGDLNLALFTDGLRDEVEAGITIDVAYRYFATPHRKFIIADAPGHIEFTRNMVTAASTTDTILIIVDAKQGITEQTKRHTFIASLLNLSNVVVCVNKMDLVDWNEGVYKSILTDFYKLTSQLQLPNLQFIPISALKGDNVVNGSDQMNWYSGSTLISLLETLPLDSKLCNVPARFPIQLLLDAGDRKVVAGRVEGGLLFVGDEITASPSGSTGIIESINIDGIEILSASGRMSISIGLSREMDVQRGDILTHSSKLLRLSDKFDAMLCWLSDVDSSIETTYDLQLGTTNESASIQQIHHKIDVNSFKSYVDKKPLSMNDICKVEISLVKEIAFDAYSDNQATGSFILIDKRTNATVAAGMIL